MPSIFITSIATFTVTLLLLHAACTDAQKTSVAFVINEELPIGERVGSLTEKLALDITSRSEVNFVPLTDLRLVNFNRTSGLITVRQRIDRESLCKETGACCPGRSVIPPPVSTFHDVLLPHLSDVQYPRCAIKMLVMDQRPQTPLSQQSQEHLLIQVVIYVNDLNDNPPAWSPDRLELEIPEHTVIGRKFQLPEAADPDEGPENTVQSYRLIPSDPHDHESTVHGLASDAFKLSSELIERSPGAPYKFALGLKVEADLDREKQPAYYFLLIATDGGSPQLTGSLSVIIRITDINDQTPYFRQTNPSVEILENTAVGTHIYTAVAMDDDPSDANRLAYRMGSTASAEVQRLFSIDSRIGSVVVSGDIDYESAPILPNRDSKDPLFSDDYGYLIPIEVTDQAHIAETKLRVHVLNTNDNPPTISIQSPLQRSVSKGEFYIREDAPVGTLVATITMSDADEKTGSERGFPNRASIPYCSTTNTFFTVQPLHSAMRNLFKLVTSKSLDHETKSTHGVMIVCHDAGQPVLSTKQYLTVRLEDVNDSPPVFEKAVYYARISEGLPVHTPILKIHASDADSGEVAEVRYRFVSNGRQMDYDSMVLLDEKSGQIRSGAVFDRESIKSINFTVEAVDCASGNRISCGGRVNTATTEVIVLIEDINDCPPEFEHQSYEFIIEEGHVSKVPVGKVHATDRDADGKNNRVRYQINDEETSSLLEGIQPSRLFTITPTGELYTNSVPIDREQIPLLTFSVVAMDSGEPPLSAFATVIIRIEDVNDNGPQWVYPPPGPQAASINISAYSTVGMVVARLEAIDLDIGVNGQIEYEIIRGNSQKYFDLDHLSGTLYLTKALEVNNGNNSMNEQAAPSSFALSLKATDGGDPPRSNTSLLRIIVQSIEAFPLDIQSPDLVSTSGKNQHFSSNSYFKQQSGYVDRDLLIMIVMIIITLLVSVLLIMAIVLLRCRQIHSTREAGIDPQIDGSASAGIVRVAQVKPRAWLPPPSQDSSAKSGFTLESSKSGTAAFDGHSHYMTAADTILKSADSTFGRFSPTLVVSPHPSVPTTTTLQRANHSTEPSPTGAMVYTAEAVAGNPSPRCVQQMCTTLPNNVTAVTPSAVVGSKTGLDFAGRCYMTLNPELYAIEYPYGQLKYHSGVYHQSPRRINSPRTCGAFVKSTPNIVDIEPPPIATTFGESVEVPQGEIQKRCRFKIDPSGSRLTPVLGNFDTSESTEETVDGVELEVDAIQMKRLRNAGRNSGIFGEDTLLVDIH
ncbi:protocadherin 9 [Echinococcus multilocularis]|uniref:Protocadherin 9 n=1 Tax=Echinococcus multilocularis TaxID=6211 RepID=A0A068Y9F6_ECHMU|nr:protocadherin 9 [Echinococcus multilocularis]